MALVIGATLILPVVPRAEAALNTATYVDPFKALWKAIADLEQKFLQLPPRAGGTVAFISDNDSQVLTRDGVVHKALHPYRNNGTAEWVQVATTYPFLSNINPPIPVKDIADWQVSMLIDKKGDVWVYQDNNTWVNVGQPPLR